MEERVVPQGYRFGATSCGLKAENKPDLGIIVSKEECKGEALFTQNKFVAAPVTVSREHLKLARPRAIVINSGNANACTGEQGLADARQMAAEAAEVLKLSEQQVLVASTGVIGHPLPMGTISRGIKRVGRTLSPEKWQEVAEAILTTDTRPKVASRSLMVEGKEVRIMGLAKGAGMIHPQLATMLAFVLSDANINPPALSKMFKEAVALSFNSITVEGDTSTNDAVFFLANGMAKNDAIKVGSESYTAFSEALKSLCIELAKEIIRDAEGATKFVEVEVVGARDNEEARCAARSVATSVLVKTAFFGNSPNWGRIVSALGNSAVEFEPDKVSLSLDGIEIFKEGKPVGVDGMRLKGVLLPKEIKILIDLNQGEGSWRVWTSDLSHEYVRINAEYVT